jgi:glycosyltransferase involved in cell wall biosynthesis
VVWNVRQSLADLTNERWLTRWVIRANAWLSARPSAIIYNSHTSARQHEAFGFAASLTRIIPNGFDTNLFHPDASARANVRRELGLGDDVVLIGLIGRYHPMKDHRMFLRAAALLAQGCPDVRFLLAGADVDAANPALATMIAESGIGDRVSLLGERDDTPRLNAALDIAGSASAWAEGFSNVVGEAMSCGVPCVVTDVGDSARIVGDTGIVVAPRDPQALANAWRRLISLGLEGRRALGARARQRVIDQFSLGAVVRQYEDLYDSLLARARV